MKNTFFIKPRLYATVAIVTVLISMTVCYKCYSQLNTPQQWKDIRAAREANESYNRQMRDNQEKWRNERYAEERKSNKYPSSSTNEPKPKITYKQNTSVPFALI